VTRIVVVQPALPAYRHDFFSRLHERYGDRFEVAYSPTSLGILTCDNDSLAWARRLGPLRDLGFGLNWQDGALRLPISQGDVLIVSGAPRTLSTLLLLAKARFRGAKTVWWGHYWSSTSRTWRFLLRLLLMRMADAVLFYTDAEVSEYHRLTGARDRRPLAALNNGLHLDMVRLHRRPYIAATRGREILFIGRLTEKASLGLLLEAMARPESLEGLRLHVVGSGSTETALRTQASELGLDERVSWHGATLDEEKIAETANRCLAFVYPGEVGLSLIHALAYGLPAVVHDERWRHMPEIAAFGENRTGRVFRAGRSEDLTRVLAELLDDTAALDQYSREGLAVTETSYNTQDMARRFSELVEQLDPEESQG
jgi:glycosyltransferase involved in cell wall biosynthesis